MLMLIQQNLQNASSVTGSLVATEAADTFAASGSLGVIGSLAVSETLDTFAAVGTVLVSGSLAATESLDTFASSGTVLSVASGSLAGTELADTFASTGNVLVSGSLAVTELADAFAASGTVLVSGSLAGTEPADTFSATGAVTTGVSGALAATEPSDNFSASGTVETPSTRQPGGYGAKPRKTKQREFQNEVAALREAISQAVDPVQGEAEVIAEPDAVQVVPAVGPRITIPVPPRFDAEKVAQIVTDIMAGARRASVELAARQRAAEQVRVELARIARRRRDDEFLLLMD